MDITGSEILAPDQLGRRVARCMTCGRFWGRAETECPHCGGLVLPLGPIDWTESDEKAAKIDLDQGIGADPFIDEDELQDAICSLWEDNEQLGASVEAIEDENALLAESIKELRAGMEKFQKAIDDTRAYVKRYPATGGDKALEHLDEALK